MAKVLAVDDSQSIRQMVELTLDDEDHEVTTAQDGLEALNMAKEEQFDVAQYIECNICSFATNHVCNQSHLSWRCRTVVKLSYV